MEFVLCNLCFCSPWFAICAIVALCEWVWDLAITGAVVMQWLVYPTSKQGEAGSIPTHGIYMFFIRKDQLVVRCRYLYTHYLTFV